MTRPGSTFRLIRVALVASLVAAVLLLAPASAAAATSSCDTIWSSCGSFKLTYESDTPNYKGWALTFRNTTLMGLFDSNMTRLPAWRWTGNSWVRTSRMEGTRVYAWPFAGGYAWTWTSDSGWLAMRADNVLITGY